MNAEAPQCSVVSKTSFVDVGLWLALGLQIFLSLVWLFAENHSIFGDEAAHLNFLGSVLRSLEHKVFPDFLTLYRFSDVYPPLFYLLSAPFTMGFSDSVLGGRVYAALLSIIVVALFYKILRSQCSAFTSFAGVMLLCTSASFVEISRYYLLEALLAVELLLLFYLLYRHLRFGGLRSIIFAGFTLSFAMLTKPTFVVLAFGVLLGFLCIELYRTLSKQIKLRHLLTNLTLLAAPSFVLSAPWYLDKFINRPNNPLSKLNSINKKAPGRKASDLVDFISGTLDMYTAVLPVYLYALIALLLLAFFAGKLFRHREQSTELASTVARSFVLYSSILCIVLIPCFIRALGFTHSARWNMSYFFIIILLCLILEALNPKSLRQVLTSLFLIFSVPFILDLQLVHLGSPFPAAQKSRTLPHPSPKSSGMKELARVIANHREHSPHQGAKVFMFFHIHQGSHHWALRHYLNELGLNKLPVATAPWFDAPVDLGSFINTGYFVSISPYPPKMRNSLFRYYNLYNHAPQVFKEKLERVAEIPTRFGMIRLDFLDPLSISADVIEQLAEVGLRLEKNNQYRPLWLAEITISRLLEKSPSESVIKDARSFLKKQLGGIEILSGELKKSLNRKLHRIKELLLLWEGTGANNTASFSCEGSGKATFGFVEHFITGGYAVRIIGWAANPFEKDHADSVVFALDNNLAGKAQPFLPRKDVTKRFGSEQVLISGFDSLLPLSRFPLNEKATLRAYAIWQGRCLGELRYVNENTRIFRSTKHSSE